MSFCIAQKHFKTSVFCATPKPFKTSVFCIDQKHFKTNVFCASPKPFKTSVCQNVFFGHICTILMCLVKICFSPRHVFPSMLKCFLAGIGGRGGARPRCTLCKLGAFLLWIYELLHRFLSIYIDVL